MKIYCIEDINDLKYIGSTGQKLHRRLSQHKKDKKLGNKCSSKKLNLYNCIIYTLEECLEDQRKEREKYWINKIDCVNHFKLNGRDLDNKKEYMKDYNKQHNKINYYKRKLNQTK